MNDDVQRYNGNVSVKESYMDTILVECPKCKSKATVTTNTNSYTGRLTCSSCNFTQESDELIRYNTIVKRNCDNCGESIDVTIPNCKEKSDSITVTCKHCNNVRAYAPRYDEYRLFYESIGADMKDPIFNLPLWFQTEVKREVFWAYNRKHLVDIRDYVSAKLRERKSNEYSTMVEKLPSFIKSAKNRSAIIKAIDKMMKR